jgi:pSer/pThr/pTyr-binding forkhead associated (FHA) protein
LKEGITTLGRSASSNIYLDSPVIQEKRLISNQHAYISAKRGHFYLFDGSPNGKPSQNNTFANGYPVTESGHKLSDGDVIILAALDYNNPRPDLPGAVGFIFHAE